MKSTKPLLAAMMILPWLSVPLLGVKSFKRFLPGALFINLVVILETIIARKRVWWWFYKRINPTWKGETPLIWGPFIVGTLWIMKLTYGKFFRYILLNTLVDGTFTYIMVSWFKRLGIGSLVRLEKIQLMSLFLMKACILYAFQFMNEIRKKQKVDIENC